MPRANRKLLRDWCQGYYQSLVNKLMKIGSDYKAVKRDAYKVSSIERERSEGQPSLKGRNNLTRRKENMDKRIKGIIKKRGTGENYLRSDTNQLLLDTSNGALVSVSLSEGLI